tara:strand:+ start:5479 stop:5658 length:180 start_codon:yes stop_codon:yes gene_type:complete
VERMSKIKGVCIKSYEDEDDLQDFEDGKIEQSEIKVYKVGDESEIMEGYYDKKYWKAIV